MENKLAQKQEHSLLGFTSHFLDSLENVNSSFSTANLGSKSDDLAVELFNLILKCLSRASNRPSSVLCRRALAYR